MHTLNQAQQVVFRVGKIERWHAEDTLQEVVVLTEESDCTGLRFWWEVLRNDLFGFGLTGSYVIQEGGAIPIY